MIARLEDPWFEARFLVHVGEGGSFRHVDSLAEADSVFFWCPCGYGKPEYPLDGARPHGLVVSFLDPPHAPPASASAGTRNRAGQPSRWRVRGTGLGDLSLDPSIDVGADAGSSCWHGWVRDGNVFI